jgi:hypothetical protein
MIEFFANLYPCAIGIEACGTAHFIIGRARWKRRVTLHAH